VTNTFSFNELVLVAAVYDLFLMNDFGII